MSEAPAPPPLSRRQTPIPFNTQFSRPMSPIGVSSEALSLLQTSLDEFSFHHSGIRDSPLGPLLQNLAGTHPSQSEALLLTVLLAVHQQNQNLSSKLMLLETKLPNPERTPSSITQQRTLSDLTLSIAALSTKVERMAQSKSAPPPPAPKAKKGKKADDGKEEVKKPLPMADRRFYAPRNKQEAFAEPQTITAALPVILGRALKAANFPSELSIATSATINPNGTVTILTDPLTPASAFIPYFPLLTKALNEAIPVGENPFLALRSAPTNVDVVIHNIPTFAIPEDDRSTLTNVMSEAILFAKEVQISNARYLKPKPEDRKEKKTTSIVVACSAADAKRISTSIRLFSRPRKANVMWSSSPSTQCKKCFHYGHPTQGCTEVESWCPMCLLPHSKSEHRCSIPTCPKGGYSKSIVRCCDASSPTCRVCLGNHLATDLDCPNRKKAMEEAKAKQTKKSNLVIEEDTSMNN